MCSLSSLRSSNAPGTAQCRSKNLAKPRLLRAIYAPGTFTAISNNFFRFFRLLTIASLDFSRGPEIITHRLWYPPIGPRLSAHLQPAKLLGLTSATTLQDTQMRLGPSFCLATSSKEALQMKKRASVAPCFAPPSRPVDAGPPSGTCQRLPANSVHSNASVSLSHSQPIPLRRLDNLPLRL